MQLVDNKGQRHELGVTEKTLHWSSKGEDKKTSHLVMVYRLKQFFCSK